MKLQVTVSYILKCNFCMSETSERHAIDFIDAAIPKPNIPPDGWKLLRVNHEDMLICPRHKLRLENAE
jgi:hypothetical protein